MTNLEFPVVAKQQYGINAVEYVNQFFKDKANDTKYLGELLKISKDNGVKNHLIMIDGEGDLGDLDIAIRTKAVENHYKWVDAAKFLECATIRVNAFGKGSEESNCRESWALYFKRPVDCRCDERSKQTERRTATGLQ